MINHSDRHPLAGGRNFKNLEGEIIGARVLLSSRQIEATAREWEGLAVESASKAEIARQHQSVAQKIAANPAHSEGIRAGALELAQGYKKTAQHFEAEEVRLRDGADRLRGEAEAARNFEARWRFDVYRADEKLDTLKREFAREAE